MMSTIFFNLNKVLGKFISMSVCFWVSIPKVCYKNMETTIYFVFTKKRKEQKRKKKKLILFKNLSWKESNKRMQKS